ncbi:polyphosphate polymerase domain-containing protein [Prolixibacteraceae bacterium JC049]|nr:polyphosphate polymerase domain-containing protein [Prolixibacteraceae bacterium JC049]
MKGYTRLDDYRYERKYVAVGHEADQVEWALRRNTALFRPKFSGRQINNIYLDTPGLNCFHDNLFGNGSRWKVRIRWYGETLGEIKQPILEYKLKKGLVGTKRSWMLASFTMDENFDFNTLLDLIDRSDLDDEQVSDLKSLRPVLLNSYSRKYFVSFDGKLRATIDRNLKYYQLKSSWNSLFHPYEEKCKSVLELKYNKNNDELARDVSEQFPYRLDKNSKYATGMQYFNQGIAE